MFFELFSTAAWCSAFLRRHELGVASLFLLTFLTGSPVKALLVVLLLWFFADRFTFRLFPNPLGIFRRASRRAELFATLAGTQATVALDSSSRSS